MQLRLPWILSRKRLIVAVVADAILFALLYYASYIWRFGVWPGFSPRLAVLLMIWSLCSYVIGRYVSGAKNFHVQHIWNFLGKQLICTGFVLFLTLGITLFHVWLLNQNSIQASFRSFLFPFLGSLAVLSPLVQLIICRLTALQDHDRNSVWSYIGSEAGCRQLQEMLKWSRVRVRIEHVLPQHLNQSSSSLYIVDNFYTHPGHLLKSLCRSEQDGSTILSRLSWCELFMQRFPSEFLSDADLLDGCFLAPNSTLQRRLKRVGDVAVASALLILTAPLIIILAFLIKLSDGGPVFYSQLRTGLHGVPYRIWKLRSMRTDAEYGGAQWSSRVDPRITKIGSILRRTRLDELPQLWCVLTDQ